MHELMKVEHYASTPIVARGPLAGILRPIRQREQYVSLKHQKKRRFVEKKLIAPLYSTHEYIGRSDQLYHSVELRMKKVEYPPHNLVPKPVKLSIPVSNLF